MKPIGPFNARPSWQCIGCKTWPCQAWWSLHDSCVGVLAGLFLVLQFGKYTQVSILHRCQKSLTAFVFLQLFDPTTRTLAQGMVNRNLDEGKLVHQNIFLYQNWNQHSYIIHKSSFFLYQMGWVKKENGQLKWICMLSTLHSETCIFTIDPFWIIHKYIYIYSRKSILCM